MEDQGGLCQFKVVVRLERRRDRWYLIRNPPEAFHTRVASSEGHHSLHARAATNYSAQ